MAGADTGKAALIKACNTAYDKYRDSCSHSVWAVLRATLNPVEPYRVANDLVDHMITCWTEVTLDDGHTLSNRGVVVVGGTRKAGGSGHVVVVYPGDKKPNGGYPFYWERGKRNLIQRSTGFYPRVMSTTRGTWPGASSRGDKTVWDPWGSDEAFAAVKFWTPAPVSTT
jgi:hypothetical protein